MTMKRILIGVVIFNALLVVALAGALYLAVIYPYQVGHPLYRVQRAGEQLMLHVRGGSRERAEWALQLAERRLADLAIAQGHQIPLTLEGFEAALNVALDAITQLPSDDDLHRRAGLLCIRADVVLIALRQPTAGSPTEATVRRLQRRIAAYRTRDGGETAARLASLQPAPSTLSQAIPIQFLGDFVDHAGIFPLEGAHARVDCLACHIDGRYVDTPTECEGCHQVPVSARYPYHFAGGCEDCHDAESWRPYTFDHVGVVACESCHLEETPPDHDRYTFISYDADGAAQGWWSNLVRTAAGTVPAGTPLLSDAQLAAGSPIMRPCSWCHVDTTDWKTTVFDHAGFDACASCHQDDAPDEHYDGECSLCHRTSSWTEIVFDHTGLDRCQQCHTSQHEDYPELCRSCHTPDDGWTTLYTHRSATDCIRCHEAQRPAGHPTEQCSTCHTTEDWESTTFDHAGSDDCESCHSQPNHYTKQCANCHTTEA